MLLPELSPGYYAVFLEDLRAHVRLGVLEHEIRPQAVSFSVAIVVSRVGLGDGIEDVVDYNLMRQTVLGKAQNHHFGLQESLCEAVIEDLRGHPNVYGVVIETRKLTVYDDAAAVGCRMASVEPEALL